jgi:hypothetical protein
MGKILHGMMFFLLFANFGEDASGQSARLIIN